MENEVRNYEKYKRLLKFMLACSGLWPNYAKHPRALRVFLSVCSGFASGAVSYGILRFCVKFVANINLLTRGLGLVVSFSSAFLKVCTLSLHQRDLQSLNEGVSANFERDLEVPEFRPHLLAHFRTFSKFFYMFHYSVATNVLLYALIPLSLIRHGKYIRMYPQVMPFHYEPGGAVHWSLYGFELFAGFYLWAVTCGVDSVFGFYALHMVGELRLLSFRFQGLQSSKDYKRDLKVCVDRHNVLARSQHALERVFGFLAIWLAVTCAIVLCALIFQATETKNMSVLKVCYLICYSFLKLLQAYSYAWFGNIIHVESKACLESMYNAHWPGSGDTQFMSDVLIVLSQKPLAFKAKGVMLLELDMFTKIVNTSVSYFFLLQTLEENLDNS